MLLAENENQIKLKCICGNTQLAYFNASYQYCKSCETLISNNVLGKKSNIVTDDNEDFYGREYWFSHQKEISGGHDIVDRARHDLSERCVYWVQTILKYKLPDEKKIVKVIEIGSGHGGLVALLANLGYQASGIELSPTIVELSRLFFQIEVLLGTVENQKIEPQSLDIMVMMDVLEHLDDPIGTLRKCLGLLKDDGLLIIQTPRFRENKFFEEMLKDKDRFIEMLRPDEHIYLFSQKSVEKILSNLGFKYIQFEKPIFSHYDMFLIASKMPMPVNSNEKITQFLSTSRDTRIMQAFFDLNQKCNNLNQLYDVADKDRKERLEIIENQAKILEILNNDLEKLNSRFIVKVFKKSLQLKENFFKKKYLISAKLKQMSSLIIQKLTRGMLKIYRSILSQFYFLKKIRESFVVFISRLFKPEIFSSVILDRIVVDLTPVQAGGANGGAKIMTLELIHHMMIQEPMLELILLCNDQNQEEISKLENSKIKVVNVKKITSIYLLKPNLLFCPFSAPFYAHSAVPCVSVVYDLQHRTYPYFFSVNEIGHRENMLLNVSKKCDEVICISDYVKSTLLETKLMNERKINTVHIQLPKRLPSNLNEENNQKDLLNELGLISDKYFYYPANFWPHKNHMVLFTAFAMFKAESSGNQYKLVCSGSKNEQMDYYKDCVKIMGLENEIIFTGYLSDQEVMCLFKNCKLIVYPSLYEGFGMPIVEALFYKKLIVCSNKCSLPEVGGSAAIYFDPRKPQDLYNIFLKIINNSSLFIQCEKKLENQYLKFSSPEVMTTQYLTVFKRAIKNHSTLLVSSIYGVYLDGWAGENLLVEYARGYKPRRIKMSVFVPSFVSEEDIIFEIKNQDSQLLRKMEITKEKIQVFEIDIPLNQGSVTIRSSHSFCPKDNGSPDDRVLSFILQKCEIISFNNSLTLFPKQVET